MFKNQVKAAGSECGTEPGCLFLLEAERERERRACALGGRRRLKTGSYAARLLKTGWTRPAGGPEDRPGGCWTGRLLTDSSNPGRTSSREPRPKEEEQKKTEGALDESPSSCFYSPPHPRRRQQRRWRCVRTRSPWLVRPFPVPPADSGAPPWFYRRSAADGDASTAAGWGRCCCSCCCGFYAP